MEQGSSSETIINITQPGKQVIQINVELKMPVTETALQRFATLLNEVASDFHAAVEGEARRGRNQVVDTHHVKSGYDENFRPRRRLDERIGTVGDLFIAACFGSMLEIWHSLSDDKIDWNNILQWRHWALPICVGIAGLLIRIIAYICGRYM